MSEKTLNGLPRYRLLTGPDDASFCQRVSEMLDKGYELYGSPSISWDPEKKASLQHRPSYTKNSRFDVRTGDIRMHPSQGGFSIRGRSQILSLVAIDFYHLSIRYGCAKISSVFGYQPDCR